MTKYNDNYFITIAKSKNLTSAAEQLYISQPSLSKYLQRLEKRYGVAFFNHSKSPLKLTYAGECYLQYLLKTKEQEKELEIKLSEIREHGRDRIRIGIPLWKGTSVLPRLLPEFSKRYPLVSIELKEANGDVLEKSLIDDELDFCIIHKPVSALDVTYETILKERILLIGKKDHPLITKTRESSPTPVDGYRSFDLNSLQKTPVIMPHKGQKLRRAIDACVLRQNLDLNVIMEVENVSTILELVANGYGLAFIPELGIQYVPDAALRLIDAFTVNTPPLTITLVVVYKKQSLLSTASKQFIGLLKELFSSDLWKNVPG